MFEFWEMGFNSFNIEENKPLKSEDKSKNIVKQLKKEKEQEETKETKRSSNETTKGGEEIEIPGKSIMPSLNSWESMM